ncbi:hypothetical protein [Massilibacteroides sp.]|uniref:hypothetical protein n=1 Tax=Massilibacteroides sp. TaxID=2034766 RepID=UPI0026372C6A|nr:hypothetical protein [Massilibacteroides sp.]MDD4516384.1 hypothetical protein [Massilibacteroides sp.]
MHTTKRNNDVLRELFSRLPEKQLPDNFRVSMMQKIKQEAVCQEKQEERKGLLITISIAAIILILGILALSFLKISPREFRIPDFSTVPFYLYIGGLVSLLLIADYKFRKRFNEKHSK